jgi:ABC-type uncharacterized transport system fused permease/ATPase subunit
VPKRLRIVVEVALVYLFVLTNEWNVLFYNSLQDRDWDAFVWSLIVFLGLAASMVVLVVAQYFLGQTLIIRWREWMVRRYLENWLSESRLYRVQFVKNPVDNIHLRIASDVYLPSSTRSAWHRRSSIASYLCHDSLVVVFAHAALCFRTHIHHSRLFGLGGAVVRRHWHDGGAFHRATADRN